jgi:hypothetical protein
MFILIGSLFGAAYFGYNGTTIYAVIGWSCFCTIWFMISNKSVLHYARENAYGADSKPTAGSNFTTLLIFVAIATCLTGVQISVYYLAAQFS